MTKRQTYWAWVEAIEADQKKKNPEPLIRLLRPLVPPHARSYLAELLKRRFDRVGGRPKQYTLTPKQAAYLFAVAEMGTIIEERPGLTVLEAATEIAPNHNLKPKTLADVYSNKSEHGRKLREVWKRPGPTA